MANPKAGIHGGAGQRSTFGDRRRGHRGGNGGQSRDGFEIDSGTTPARPRGIWRTPLPHRSSKNDGPLRCGIPSLRRIRIARRTARRDHQAVRGSVRKRLSRTTFGFGYPPTGKLRKISRLSRAFFPSVAALRVRRASGCHKLHSWRCCPGSTGPMKGRVDAARFGWAVDPHHRRVPWDRPKNCDAFGQTRSKVDRRGAFRG